jgi:hypothetical protein
MVAGGSIPRRRKLLVGHRLLGHRRNHVGEDRWSTKRLLLVSMMEDSYRSESRNQYYYMKSEWGEESGRGEFFFSRSLKHLTAQYPRILETFTLRN